MHIDIRAIPRLTSPEPAHGAGHGVTARDWAKRIDDLRPRFDRLSHRHLCALLRDSYFDDLTALVVSPPFSIETLSALRTGLAEAVWIALRQECERLGESLLPADQACGTWQRLLAALDEHLKDKATQLQLDRLMALAQHLAAPDCFGFEKRMEQVPARLIPLLLIHSGGIEGALAQRFRASASAVAWSLIRQDCQEQTDAPLTGCVAEELIDGLTQLIESARWPEPPSADPIPLASDAGLEELLQTLAGLAQSKPSDNRSS